MRRRITALAAVAAALLLAACSASPHPSPGPTVTVTRTAPGPTVTRTRTRVVYRVRHHKAHPAPAPAASPAAPAVALGCKVLQTGSGGEEFSVTTNGGTYSGTVSVSFYGPAGSGQVFPGTSVQGATVGGSWQPVPADDIGASAEPIGCIASAG